MTFAPGTRLGPYEIRSARNLPGLGEVYDAHDHDRRRDVAIRVLRTDFGANPERLGRFEQDVRAAAALTHPNILTVHNIGTDAQAAYIVSEPLHGATLGESLNRGVLPVSTVIQYALQIAHGLAAAHEKGIVHRDLTPEHILIAPDGRVKILGFGLAAVTQSESALTAPQGPSATSAQGTLSYMSPEQVRGMAADHRSDIFAFGAILYEMLSGARAFGGANPADTVTAILQPEPPALAADRDVPPVLLRIVQVCLKKDPAERVATAGEVASVLHTLWSQPAPVAAAAAAAAPKRRFRVASWVVAVIGLVALAAAVALAAMRIVESVWPGTPVRLSPSAPPSSTRSTSPPAQPTPAPAPPPGSAPPAPPSVTPSTSRPPVPTPARPARSAAPPPVPRASASRRAAVPPAAPKPSTPLRVPPGPRDSQLVWFAREGVELGRVGEPADYGDISLSPDGTRVAVSIREPGGPADIWIIDAGSGERTRLTSTPDHDMAPVWSPDGSRVAFASVRGDSVDVYEMASDGTGDERALLAAPGDQVAHDWTSSGGFLLYTNDRPGTAQGAHQDLWARRLPGGRAFAFLRTVHRAALPSSSPDGRWVAFALLKNGARVEDVYVARFPKYNGRRRVSAGGGLWPRWRGSDIFYVDPEHRLVSVSVSAHGAQVEAGPARQVSPLAVKAGWGYPYDVSADGERILVNAPC